jgi:putative endopeptidase
MPSRSPINPKDFDITVKPTDDFFRFVNGKWLAANPIPPEESRWGSFDVLRREAEDQLKQILEEVAGTQELKEGGDERRIRDFYLTAMDAEKCNRLGVAPLAGMLKVSDDITDGATLARAIGQLHRWGIGAFWSPFVEQDEKQSEVMALHLYQGGLSLPDRDYYLNEDEKSKEIREKYLKYVGELSGSADSRLRGNDGGGEGIKMLAQTIIAIETRLAKCSRTRVELRDVEKQYNKMTSLELAAKTPNVFWREYFDGAAMPAPDYFIVGQPEFFEELNRMLAEIPLDDLKKYLRWQVLNGMTSCLSEEIETQAFDFYARTFRGTKEMKPRWQRVLNVMNGLLDEMLGKLYVKKHFSENAKKKVNALVDRLVAAYRVRVEKLDWMGAETKAKAQEKLGSFSRKLGYPDVWKDFAALTVGTESYADNYLRACMFEFDRQMKKIGKPVDRTEWLMPPQMVNAYYMPPMNEIAFPAAILQPPFFDPDADDAVNFGGIGSVIGHELTHGFDDQGSLFDPHGNVKNWWTEEDKKRFDEKANRLAAQYDAFEPAPGVHVNGKLTLGENIADLGGAIIAYDALHLALAEKPPTEKIDNMTPEQRFFVNFAVCERGQVREESLRTQLQTDPHSPSECRVNGPVSNFDEFHQAFDGKPGDKLWRDPDGRVKIW